MSLIWWEGVKQGVKEGARLCFGRLFTIINGSEALSTTTVEPIALRAAVRQLYCSNICRNCYQVPKLPFACKMSSFASVLFKGNVRYFGTIESLVGCLSQLERPGFTWTALQLNLRPKQVQNNVHRRRLCVP